MNNNMIKVLALSVLAASTVLTGCASKNTGASEVMVYPLGHGNSANHTGYYDGGALTTNSSDLVNAAAQLQQAVYFGFDSSDISSAAAQVLSQHAQLLQAHPDAKVVVGGHADERGSPEYNMVLGERRAKAVQAYLSSQGVDASRIETISYGEEQPAVQGSNEAAWSKNRRAELQY